VRREPARALAWEVRKSNASPSPATLRLGKQLRESAATAEASPAPPSSILGRRSLGALSCSSVQANGEFNAERNTTEANSAPTVQASGPAHARSAWDRKPNIVSSGVASQAPHGSTEHPPFAMETISVSSIRKSSHRSRQQTQARAQLHTATPASPQTQAPASPQAQGSAGHRFRGITVIVDDDDIEPGLENGMASSSANSLILAASAGVSPSTQDDDESLEDHCGNEPILYPGMDPATCDDEEDEEVAELAAIGGPQICTPRSTDGEHFTFVDLAASNLRWGDECVGLTDEAVAVISPKRKRPCELCARHVIQRDSDAKLCSACQVLAASRPDATFTREAVMRTLHEKLSSPERRRPSPWETKRRQVQKQATAKLNREKIDLVRQAKLRRLSSRQEQAAKTKEEGILAQERAISERLERAAVAREAKLKSVAKKAENESLKVNEIQFINELTEQEKMAQLNKKLEDGEKRRLEYIGTIRERAEKQSERAEARRLREEDKERQLREAMQKRHEDAEKRKAEALEEQRRKLDEMVIEATAKVNERRTEMEKEREARLLLIRERKERAEQERMKHLLAKRSVARASNASPHVHSSAPASPTASGAGGGAGFDPGQDPSVGGDELGAMFCHRSVASRSYSDVDRLDLEALGSMHSRSAGGQHVSVSGTSAEEPAQSGRSFDSAPKCPVRRKGSTRPDTPAPPPALSGLRRALTPEPGQSSDMLGQIHIVEGDADHDESRSAVEMLAQERQMKKKSRKARGKMSALCLELASGPSGQLTAPTSSAAASVPSMDERLGGGARPRSKKFGRAVDALLNEGATGEKGDALLDTLASGVRGANSVGHLECIVARGRALMEVLLRQFASYAVFQDSPRHTIHAMQVAAAAVEHSAELAAHTLAADLASGVVDLCVQLLRSPSGQEGVAVLEPALVLLRALLGSTAREPAASARVHVACELVKLCLYSTLTLRLAEQCTQIKCGRKWMGCAHSNMAESSQAGWQATNSANSGCPNIGTALMLVRSSLGLCEAVCGVVLRVSRLGKESAHAQSTVSAFTCALRTTSLFRIISQLVAGFVAVEGFVDQFARPWSAATEASASASAGDASELERGASGGSSAAHKSRREQPHKGTLRSAAHSGLRALNLLACLDLGLVQAELSSPALPFELQQLLRYVVIACSQSGSLESASMPAPLARPWGELSEELVPSGSSSQAELFAELVVFMGFYAQSNANNQESLNWGRSPTPLSRLCSLPFCWFVSPVGKSILFPTLLSVCCGNTRAVNIVTDEVSPLHLSAYLRSRSDPAKRPEPPNQGCRFPAPLWAEALELLDRVQCSLEGDGQLLE